jgi:hypothetical protein
MLYEARGTRQCGRKVLKWGKSDGVTEDQIGVLAIVSYYISRGYKRFSMRDPPLFS